MNMYSFDLFVCAAALDPAPVPTTVPASASAVFMSTTVSPYPLPAVPAWGSGFANVSIFVAVAVSGTAI